MAGIVLDCLGSGFAFSGGSYWSGFLLNGRILLDAPPQTLAHLYRLGPQTLVDLDLVLLSHEHSDHIGGMDLLLLELEQGETAERRTGRPLAVASPPAMYDRLRDIVGPSDRLPPRDDPRIEWLEGDAPSSFERAGVRVERIEVEHDPRLNAHGYRVHLGGPGDRGGIVAYSGDTRLCPALGRLAEDADLLIVECGGRWPGKTPTHLDWPDVFALRERVASRTEFLVTHYDPRTAPAAHELPRGVRLAEDFARYEY